MSEAFAIRRAKEPDLPCILEIYERARRFMRETGNPNQWSDGHPFPELLREDIEKGNLYILEREEKICGVFALLFGEDPTYAVIKNGSWLSDAPYATIHRIASCGEAHGILESAVNFASGKFLICGSIRTRTTP